jgi:plastocyanin
MKLSSKFVFVVVFLFALMLGTKSAFAATTNVSITSTGFVPESITVTVGDTVVWTNNDTTDHTATDDELTWDTDIIDPALTGSQVFNTAGTYTYSDTIDPTLTGTIIVKAATSTTSSSSTTTTSTTSATPKPKAATQPVSGVSGPTLTLMSMGGALLALGFFSLKTR